MEGNIKWTKLLVILASLARSVQGKASLVQTSATWLNLHHSCFPVLMNDVQVLHETRSFFIAPTTWSEQRLAATLAAPDTRVP